MGKIVYDREQIFEVIDRVVERTMRMDMTWDWPCGVAYYGIAAAYEATGKTGYLDALKERVDELIDLGLPVFTVNTCAMGHVLLTLFQVTGEETYKKIIEDKIAYLEQDALRFGAHVLQHTVSAANDFPEQCWADTLFMAAYLQDEKNGLWFHGYDNRKKDHMSGFYWGRANCWAAYTMSEVSHILPECYLYPAYLEIAGSLNEQLSNLKLYQTEDGLWRTLLDDEESYEEVSASAGIGAAMLLKKNPLYIKYINRTVEGILENISEDGRVMNVSAGTAVMKDRDGYRNISRKWIQGWGQGMALAFFAALLDYEKLGGDGAL